MWDEGRNESGSNNQGRLMAFRSIAQGVGRGRAANLVSSVIGISRGRFTVEQSFI